MNPLDGDRTNMGTMGPLGHKLDGQCQKEQLQRLKSGSSRSYELNVVEVERAPLRSFFFCFWLDSSGFLFFVHRTEGGPVKLKNRLPNSLQAEIARF